MDRRTFFSWMFMSGLLSSLASKGVSLSSSVPLEKKQEKRRNSSIQEESLAAGSTRVFKVSDYGALVTGITNDAETIAANTKAIQEAIDTAGKQGGGIVQIPAGKFQIAPPNLNDQKAASLVIDYDNITLTGAGIGQTILYSRSDYSLFDGPVRRRGAVAGKPTTIGKRVRRGIGILVKGTVPPAKPRQNIKLQNFEIIGGSPGFEGYTGNRGFPANTTTGDGWDVTHKGICLDFDVSLDNITINNVSVHDFRGELIYAGGRNVGNLKITNCQLFNSNGSLLSLDANLTVTNCDFGKTATAWVENAPVAPNKSYLFSGCNFHDSIHHGLVLAQGKIDLPGRKALVTNCEFRNSLEAGIGIFGGVNNCTVENNKFFDCGTVLIVNSNNQGIKLLNNQIYTTRKTIVIIRVFGNRIQDVLIQNNTFNPSTTLDKCVSMNYLGDLTNVRVINNNFKNCVPPRQTSRITNEKPLIEGNKY
ncbi:MAG: right-handed parallel beta-helix repeat-containing protein [Aphanothece sp. CMT-3BRIN-NPC111]|jgi:hypothetical protein|nr:right-handed parallel beta-helix repeat-containing protein [Aphanothece sp. CMT-3BRIN-NPC111]